MDLFAPEPMEVAPGAHYVPGWLSIEEQLALISHCRRWGAPPAGFHVPRMFDGKPLSIRSLYLGWYWRHTKGYTRFVDPEERTPVKPFPPELAELAQRACADTFRDGRHPAFESSIINWYDDTATLGMHQDRGETEAVVRRGSPVVTISLGDTCIFRFGNTESRNRPWQDIELRSGDLFLFGGPSRMAFHGVLRILPRSAPPVLGLAGRLSVTVRESGLPPPGSD